MATSSHTNWAMTVKQQRALDALVCERISCRPVESNRILQSFTNKRVSGRNTVLGHLQREGLTDDQQGETAVYLVRTKDGVGLLAFSLKCGELFQPYGRDVYQFKALKAEFFKAYMRSTNQPRVKAEKAFDKLCQIKGLQGKRFVDRQLRGDGRRDVNKEIKRVQRTMSGVQLVDFCKNDGAADTWNALGLNTYRTSGQVLFWQFIAPILFRVHDLVGCEHAFLYAADLTADQFLMTYYTEALNFHPEIEAGANKPQYDLFCSLMSQRIADMKIFREDFLKTFNKPLDYDDGEEYCLHDR